MRIALVNSIRFYGGGEKRVLRAAHEFGRRGHPVTVLGVPGGELASRCGTDGIPFSPVEFGRYYAPATVRGLARALEKCRPDAAVCYDERSVRIAAGARVAGPLRRLPLVFYVGLEGSFKDKPYNRYMVDPRICAYVANAEAIRRELLGFGWIDPQRLHVIRDGVDPGPVESADGAGIREELGAGPEDVVFLVAARLVPEKGHAFLLDAAARLGPERGRLKLWIAGEGPELGRLKGQVAALGLEECVRLLGFRADVPRLLRAADGLCHPSRREGIPNAVREAMVAGLPVVAVAASGTPEVVAHGETGLLSAPDDGEALAQNLRALLTDGDLRRRLGEAGRRRALAEFGEDLCAERWLELLAGIAGR